MNRLFPLKPSFRSKAFVIGVCVSLLALALTQYLAYQQYRIDKDAETKKVLHELNAVTDKLQTALSNGLSATKTLAVIVETYGEPDDFSRIAEGILESHQYIDGIQLTRQGIITHVYPITENQAALGLDVLQDPVAQKEAYKSIESKKLFFAGPLAIKQGGIAVVGRLPIYTGGKFHGFSAVIIRLATLFQAADIPPGGESADFYYQLSKPNPVTGHEEFFLPRVPLPAENIAASIQVPDGEWNLYVSSKNTSTVYESAFIFSLLGIIFSLLVGFIAHQLISLSDKLNTLVQEKTARLAASEHNSRMMMERISDAFISFDKDLRYSYLNKRAIEIFGFDPDKVIGKHIWKELPHLVHTRFYDAFTEAMQEQKYVHLEFYFSETGLWFENHLYPSPSGLSVFLHDITPYKEALQKLEASENYFRTLTENITDGIVLMDHTGKVIYQSASAEKISGYSLDEVAQIDAYSLVHPDDREEDRKMFIELAQQPGKAFERIHRVRHKNGNYLWLEGTYVNLLNDPTIRGIVYNYHDATARIEAQKASVQEKQLSDSIINSLPGIFYLYNRKGKFIRWNKNFETVSGYTREEIEQLSPLDFFEGADRDLIREKIRSVFEHGQDEAEANFVTKSKERIPYYFNGRRVSFDQVEYLLGMGIDITDLKQTQAQAHALFREKETVLNRINDAVVSLNPQWQYTFLNDAALGTHPLGREKTLGKTILEVHPELEASPFWDMCKDAMRTMQVMELENYYPPLDTWFSAKAYPASDGLTIFYTDITERKKAEQELGKLLTSLQARNKDLQQFSYIVSHNLRAPIAKIQGLISIMDENPAKNNYIVKLIEDTAASLDEIVKDISLIVSARSTNQEKYEPVSLEREISQIIQILHIDQQKDVTITKDFSEVETCYCIKSYVYSILYNLISNALKYRHPDRPLKIHIQTKKAEDFVCLSVSDNGIGIDMERYGTKLFGLYKRFHQHDVPGKGLGLNLVKTQAESLGGRVEAESTLNTGSVFKVYLPVSYPSDYDA